MKKVLSFLKSTAITCINYGSDAIRYLQFAQIGMKRFNFEQLSARMIASSHVIEKGMSLPSPRMGYGQAMLNSLIGLMKRYSERGYDTSSFAYTNAMGVLRSYQEYHAERKHDLGQISKKISEVLNGRFEDAGYFSFARSEYLKAASGSFEECALSRYSVRAFSGTEVPESSITAALEVARKTPSVCNRQSWKVYWIKSCEGKQFLAELHNGHRGFGDQVDSFLVVTTDLQSFFGIGERNQSYVDGGLYSMSLIYALHHAGVAVCPLNWCMPVKKDKLLRNGINIPKSENIILVIAIGMLQDEIRVAKSMRKSIAETLLVR